MGDHSTGALRAVWSFWSKPLLKSRRASWFSMKHHLLAWVLSFETARKHYPKTSLITDDEGARLLVDELDLPFEHVSTELNALHNQDSDWWSLGKLYAYRVQTEPFVHLDTDVFLWKPLPEKLERSSVFAQNPEPFSSIFCYRPERVERALRYPKQGWLPEEWVWYRRARRNQRGDCCGIFGGARTDFIRYYADAALRLVSDPANQRGLSRFTEKVNSMVLIEQYLLAACVEYHSSANPSSTFADVRIEYLFNSLAQMYNRDYVTQVGFTHLIGDAKKNSVVVERLENRVRRDYPERYERCLSLLNSA